MINIRGDEEMEENHEQIILGLTKQVEQLQKQIEMLTAVINQREGKTQIAQKVADMRDNIMQQAAVLGQKAKKVEETYNLNRETKDNILQQYEEALSEIEEQFENRFRYILKEKRDWQNEEQKNILRECELKQDRKQIKKSPEYAEQVKAEKALTKEIKKLLDKGELETGKAKIEELKSLKAENPLTKCDEEIEKLQHQRKEIQKMINECQQELGDCVKERNDSIEQATQDKDNQLMEMKKQNIFQRIAGNVMNKLNGAKKFKDMVVQKVVKKVGHIKQEIAPAIKETVQGKMAKFIERMSQNRENIIGENRETKEEIAQRIGDKSENSKNVEPIQEQSQEEDLSVDDVVIA